jgi:hypothetical protein
MKCEDIKIYPTGNGTLQNFIIPYTYIKSTAKLLLLIMAVIDYEEKKFCRVRLKNGQENKIE